MWILPYTKCLLSEAENQITTLPPRTATAQCGVLWPETLLSLLPASFLKYKSEDAILWHRHVHGLLSSTSWLSNPLGETVINRKMLWSTELLRGISPSQWVTRSLLVRLLCLHWSLPPSGPSYSSSWPMFSHNFNHSLWKLSWFMTHTVVLYVSALGPWGSFSMGLLSPGKFSFIQGTSWEKFLWTELLTILCDSEPDLTLLVDGPVSPTSIY